MVEFQIHSLKTFHVLLDMSKQVWWQQVCYVGSLLILLQTKEINYKTDLRLQSHQFKRKPLTLNLRRFAEVWEKVFNLAQWNFRGDYCNLIFTTIEKSKAKCQVSFHLQNWLTVLENNAFFVALLRILVKRIWVFFLPALEKCEKATVFHAVNIKRSAPISSQLTLYCYLKYGLSPVFILNDEHLSCLIVVLSHLSWLDIKM